MLVRAVNPLFIQPDATGIQVSSPLVPTRLRIGPEIAELLISARTPLSVPEAECGAASSRLAAVEQLLALGFLVKAEEDEPAPAAPSPWDAWGPVAWWFHQRTRNVAFLPAEQVGDFRSELLTRPRPSGYAHPGPETPVLLLPRVRRPMTMSFQDVLEQRRTHRTFTGQPVSLDAFATLLHYSFAPLRFSDCGDLGVTQLRAAATGGARHETDAYVAVFDVRDVSPGLYRYDAIRHGLLPVDARADREFWEGLTSRQGFFTTGSFALITVAVAERMSWKYRQARAYRFLLQDVGHVAQVVSMTATALGLGAAITGAFQDDLVDQALGLDPGSEFATFVMVCGIPRTRDDGMPLDSDFPSKPWDLS
ncbi:SagB/ThcOx family dehydrogenase [Kitasatospora mediocidica]|uniref:SagB/ThcOx family dehydrogenase n=1 Tax=Kitasatospora mediocidica TaxID=58352 RepID=UPI00068D3661|nr:SagB/ThcOx family dehydrogenase [Kitasatospora mediocidica]